MKKNKNKNTIDSFIQSTLQNIRKLIDANVIVGNPIIVDKSTIIPINKATVGYITGGGEVTNKKTPQFSVGSTSGFNITPIGFIFINDNNATFISTQPCSPNEKILEALYTLLNKKINQSQNNENTQNNSQQESFTNEKAKHDKNKHKEQSSEN